MPYSPAFFTYSLFADPPVNYIGLFFETYFVLYILFICNIQKMMILEFCRWMLFIPFKFLFRDFSVSF